MQILPDRVCTVPMFKIIVHCKCRFLLYLWMGSANAIFDTLHCGIKELCFEPLPYFRPLGVGGLIQQCTVEQYLVHHCQGEAAAARSLGVRAMNSRDATIRCSIAGGESEPAPPGQARGEFLISCSGKIKCITGQHVVFCCCCCTLSWTILPAFPMCIFVLL